MVPRKDVRTQTPVKQQIEGCGQARLAPRSLNSSGWGLWEGTHCRNVAAATRCSSPLMGGLEYALWRGGSQGPGQVRLVGPIVTKMNERNLWLEAAHVRVDALIAGALSRKYVAHACGRTGGRKSFRRSLCTSYCTRG